MNPSAQFAIFHFVSPVKDSERAVIVRYEHDGGGFVSQDQAGLVRAPAGLP